MRARIVSITETTNGINIEFANEKMEVEQEKKEIVEDDFLQQMVSIVKSLKQNPSNLSFLASIVIPHSIWDSLQKKPSVGDYYNVDIEETLISFELAN